MKKLAYLTLILWLFLIATSNAQVTITKNDFENGTWYGYLDFELSGLPTNQVSALCFAGKDSVWIGGDWGLSLWSKIDTTTDNTQRLNWQHWKFSSSNVTMQGERVEKIFHWKNNQLLIMTAEIVGQYTTARDKSYMSDYHYIYRFYLAQPFENDWHFIYQFENRHTVLNRNDIRDTSGDINLTDLAIDRPNQLVWFCQGDFLGKLNVATGDVDSLYFKTTDENGAETDIFKISGVTLDTDQHIWFIGKRNRPGKNFKMDCIVKIDQQGNVFKYLEHTWGLSRILYNKYDNNLYVIGVTIGAINTENGKLLYDGDNAHQAGFSTLDPNVLEQCSVDQFGSFWAGYTERTEGLGSPTYWYNPNSGEDTYGGDPLASKKDVFWAVPRPGTKQVWFATYRLGIPIYTYPSYVSVADQPQNTLPEKFELLQNYPNPFNSSTTIAFSLPKLEKVNLIIYNSLGQKVSTLIDNQSMNAGRHIISFHSENYNLSSGIYFYHLSTSHGVRVGKMVLVR